MELFAMVANGNNERKEIMREFQELKTLMTTQLDKVEKKAESEE
jgi:hypothetical protein